MASPGAMGWGPSCDEGKLVTVVAAGHGWRVHRGISKIVVAFVTEWNARVETLDPDQCWSYACRPVRNSTTTSFHAWGLALDLNAVRHPLGKRGTFTSAQVKIIRELCSRYGFRWGGDFTSRADEMHCEFAGTPQDAARITAGLEEGDDMFEDADRKLLVEATKLARLMVRGDDNPMAGDQRPDIHGLMQIYEKLDARLAAIEAKLS